MFSRIANLFKGFFSLFVSGVERRNPEALLELEQENLRKQVGNFNQGLASHAGLSERLMSQVRKLEAEQKDLRAKTTAHVRAGNNSAAGQYALRLQTVEAQLAENRTQLEQAETTYKNLVKARDVAVQTARAKIESLKGAINDMRMKQAMAEIHEMSAGMITNIGGAGDTLNRLEDDGQRRARQGRGPRARRQGLGRHDAASKIKEAEMNALADQALADFAAREGISLKGAAAPAPAERSHGRHRKAARPGLSVVRLNAIQGQPDVPAPQGAPAWAAELALAYESGASGQFILFGNVHDRLAVGERLVNLADYLQDSCSRASTSCCRTTSATAHDRARRRAWSRSGRARSCRRRCASRCRPFSGSAATCAISATCAPSAARTKTRTSR